jgi:hypothetical protein
MARYNKRGSPIHWAIEGGHVDAIRLFLAERPNLDIFRVSIRERLQHFDSALAEVRGVLIYLNGSLFLLGFDN